MGISALTEQRILIVEDDLFTALDLASALEEAEAIVLGPARTLSEALDLVTREPEINAAALDVNVAGKLVFPVADVLLERSTPFIFASGESGSDIPQRFAGVAFYQKPMMPAALIHCIAGLILLQRA